MSDLIERQAAIDALGERPMVWTDSDYEIAQRNQYDMDKLAIETVPSAQPEVLAHGEGELSAQPEPKCANGCIYGWGSTECEHCDIKNCGEEKSMAELKPCPFCGTPYPYITFEHGYIDDSAIVFCNACKISVKLEENDQEGFNAETKRKAIEAWNNRAEPWRGEEHDRIYTLVR